MNMDPCKCPDEYSFMEHGDGWALYYGRCGHRHGYNLANIKEPDTNRISVMLFRLNNDLKMEKEIERLKAELKKVLGSTTLKLAAEVARARQSELDRLQNVIRLTSEECLAGGFVRGLALWEGLKFDDLDKKMLEIEGKCIERIMNQQEAKS